MSKKAEELLLTSEQQQEIVNIVAESEKYDTNLSLLEITRKVFKDNTLDGRSREGIAVKKFLAAQKVDFAVTTFKKSGLIELTDDQKKQIDANLIPYIKKEIGSLELAKIIFNRNDLSALHQETRTIIAYLDAAVNKMSGDDFKKLTYSPISDDVVRKDYQPPRRLSEVITRVNKYVGTDYKESELKSQIKKQLISLQRYLSVYRFVYQINCYTKQSQRELFEDAFIRYTHDKEDLSQEHLDMFIALAAEVVIGADIQSHIQMMRQTQELQYQDSEGRKMSMTLNEAINYAQTEYQQCSKRQDVLYKNLIQQRSKELQSKKAENATMLHLVIPWRQEDFRKATIHLAIKEKEKLKDEIKKLSSISELKAMLRGLTQEEIDADFANE